MVKKSKNCKICKKSENFKTPYKNLEKYGSFSEFRTSMEKSVLLGTMFPTHHTIYNGDQKFRRTGSVCDALYNGGLRDTRIEEYVYAVAQAVVEELTQSTRHGALQLDSSKLVLHNKNLVMQKGGIFFSECKFG